MERNLTLRKDSKMKTIMDAYRALVEECIGKDREIRKLNEEIERLDHNIKNLEEIRNRGDKRAYEMEKKCDAKIERMEKKCHAKLEAMEKNHAES